MTNSITMDRWLQAQSAEQSYWNVLDIAELLRICAEKPEFLNLIPEETLAALFIDKAVLEIGCGPLGVSIASFFQHKDKIAKLVKAEPLPRIDVKDTAAAREEWASEFVTWVLRLSNDGEYIQKLGEHIDYQEVFDTVITYNVLDHVHAPQEVLASAYRALRHGGRVLIGVDCLSVLGRLKFEYLTRRRMKGSVLVEAHPHTFLPEHVLKIMQDEGFRDLYCIGIPGTLRRYLGSHYRPAFIGTKP